VQQIGDKKTFCLGTGLETHGHPPAKYSPAMSKTQHSKNYGK
jgi:hypothetical protein